MSSSNEEYLQTQMTVYHLAALAADLDLSEFLRRINLAETMGVYGMAPLEYQKKNEAFATCQESRRGVGAPFRRKRESKRRWLRSNGLR